MQPNFSFVFFGTSQFSVYVLEALKEVRMMPSAVVTFPDKPQGRQLVLTSNATKAWAQHNNVPVLENLDTIPDADVYIVASYGKILPASIIYKPKARTLNVHPSLLPKLRGPAPIQGAILCETETGVTIMRLDDKMDEGPIVAQEKVSFPQWPPRYSEAEKILGEAGGKLLAKVLSDWIHRNIKEVEQNPALATYTKKITKEDADITNDSAEVALRKIRAYEVWPRSRKKVGQIDLIITDAHIEDGQLSIDKVIPPGKKEMPYKDYLRGQHR